MFRCFQSNVLVVPNLIHYKNLQFPEWRKKTFVILHKLNESFLWQWQQNQATVYTLKNAI